MDETARRRQMVVRREAAVTKQPALPRGAQSHTQSTARRPSDACRVVLAVPFLPGLFEQIRPEEHDEAEQQDDCATDELEPAALRLLQPPPA